MADEKHVTTSSTGAHRHRAPGRGRYDLLSPFATERVAKLYEHGATCKEFGPRNWEKGFPFSWCIDSMWRHLIKYMTREPDADHDDNLAAIVFGANCLMDFEERIARGLLPADLDDMPRYDVVALWHATASVGGVHNVYVAGPFSAPTAHERAINAAVACAVGHVLKVAGHRVHVPHAATMPFDGAWAYDDFMDLDLSLIACWATALYRVPGASEGADREEAVATERGRAVWRCLADVPVASVEVARTPTMADMNESLGMAVRWCGGLLVEGDYERVATGLRAALGVPEM